MQKKYQKALEEFKLAMKFVPYQKEIKKTIEHIESMMDKKEAIPPLTLVEELPCQ